MSKIIWDEVGKRLYETGLDRGVLYRMSSGQYGSGAPWDGLISISEKPSGGESNPIYADNMKYLNLISQEDFGASVEAYRYPDEYVKCLGKDEIAPGVAISQQERLHFGLSYRTFVGSDNGFNDRYKIHIVYDCAASTSETGHSTMSDTPEAVVLSWEVSTNPIIVGDFKPTSCLTIDSGVLKSQGLMNALRKIEDVLYGTAQLNARLPLPLEVRDIFRNQMYLVDANDEFITDSSGNQIRSSVWD